MPQLSETARRELDELGLVAVSKERISRLEHSQSVDRFQIEHMPPEERADFEQYIDRMLSRGLAYLLAKESALEYSTNDDRNQPFIYRRAELTVIRPKK